MPLYIGAANGVGEFANGCLDDIAIWNRALGIEEIRAAMNAPLEGTEAGLVGYWNFDDGTADDLTAAAHDGVLNGDAAIVDASDLGEAGRSGEPGSLSRWRRRSCACQFTHRSFGIGDHDFVLVQGE